MKPRTKFTIRINPFTGYWRIDGEHTTYENKLKKITVYDRIELNPFASLIGLEQVKQHGWGTTFEMFGKENHIGVKYTDKLKVKLTTQRETKDGITLKPTVIVEY